MTDKELTVCNECQFGFMDFLLLRAKWKGEECEKCKVKRLDAIRRRERRSCAEEHCKVHKIGRYAQVTNPDTLTPLAP